jgi:hypothetical protein
MNDLLQQPDGSDLTDVSAFLASSSTKLQKAAVISAGRIANATGPKRIASR